MSQKEIDTHSGQSVSIPIEVSPIINFQSLISHEYGHALHRRLESEGFSEAISNELKNLIDNHYEIIQILTPASFSDLCNLMQQPRDIFAELFSTNEVIKNIFFTDTINLDLFRPILRNPETQSIIHEFMLTVDKIYHHLHNKKG